MGKSGTPGGHRIRVFGYMEKWGGWARLATRWNGGHEAYLVISTEAAERPKPVGCNSSIQQPRPSRLASEHASRSAMFQQQLGSWQLQCLEREPSQQYQSLAPRLSCVRILHSFTGEDSNWNPRGFCHGVPDRLPRDKLKTRGCISLGLAREGGGSCWRPKQCT